MANEKLTESEITQIQTIRNDYQLLVTALGDLELRKLIGRFMEFS